MNTISYTLPNDLQAAVETSLANWQQHNNTTRLWEKDASLWSNRDEAQWLDWLTAVPVKPEALDELLTFAQEIKLPISGMLYYWVWAVPAWARRCCAIRLARLPITLN